MAVLATALLSINLVGCSDMKESTERILKGKPTITTIKADADTFIQRTEYLAQVCRESLQERYLGKMACVANALSTQGYLLNRSVMELVPYGSKEASRLRQQYVLIAEKSAIRPDGAAFSESMLWSHRDRIREASDKAAVDESVRFQGGLTLNCCNQTFPGRFTD